MQFSPSFAAALLVFAAGCSSDPIDGTETNADGGTIPEGMTPACTGNTLALCAGFTPTTTVDFVGFRTENTTPRPATGDAGIPGATEAAWSASLGPDMFGTPCFSATDRPACQDRLAKLRLLGDTCQGVPIVPLDVAGGAAAPQQSGACNIVYLVYTRGDDVGTISSVAEALAFFGTIDSPQEALYLAQLSGESLQCTADTPPAYLAKDGGYDILTSTQIRCGSGYSHKIIHVSAAGVISVVSDDSPGEHCSSSH